MTDQTTDPTTVEAIADLAKDTVARTEGILPEVAEDGSITAFQTVHRAANGTENVKVRTHEELLTSPYRARGTTRVTSVASFIDMTGWLASDGSLVFNDEEARKLTAVLNYAANLGGGDATGWADHRVEYTALHSPEWKKWAAADGRYMSQREFAELLQDLRHTIVEPTAADIVQIARTFTATRTAQFESGVHLQSGDVQFTYAESTKAKAGARGGTVEIPEEITLALPIFRDSDAPTEVTLEFRFDASDSGLRLGYRIRQREELVDAAWAGLKSQAVKGIATPIVDGPAPAPVNPID